MEENWKLQGDIKQRDYFEIYEKEDVTWFINGYINIKFDQ